MGHQTISTSEQLPEKFWLSHTQSLIQWAARGLNVLGRSKAADQRQLKLVETMSLGGKRQLILVTCSGESFLVGAGVESIDSIVRLKSTVSQDAEAKD
jgi:flagellar biogenesis protein FliO